MPTRPPRACAKCGGKFTGPRCPCRKPWEGSERTGKSSGVHSRRWRTLRAHLLQEHPLCTACHRAVATVLDHVVPVAEGGAMWDESNLAPMCKPCHDAKTAQEALRGRRRPR
ncbi:HNH endonuclease [Rhodococcus pyridinivorans SB3094]|uniref:HNH endonuclease n=1 Tax=Rhodococcus pyridinivorans SB3094 TaxID=1435356 RepID=V9XC02_9NOCA|nr:HNH endonuclease signature motif containing protein [Rhodococcus pyridinivorans]AHD19525.1 HNH endonuclease [Rhodococcus pyridinivorans SB3094]